MNQLMWHHECNLTLVGFLVGFLVGWLVGFFVGDYSSKASGVGEELKCNKIHVHLTNAISPSLDSC
jgi:ABC-type antimicrobial peptide transport system permease subunit